MAQDALCKSEGRCLETPMDEIHLDFNDSLS